MTQEIAVITGGGQGIGEAICKKLAESTSYTIAIIERTNKGAIVAQKLEDSGANAISLEADVTDEVAIVRFANELSQIGQVKCVVNNAAVYPRLPAIDTSFDNWLEVIKVNLGGAFLVSRVFAKYMLQHQGGKIINITSGRATGGAVNGSHYAASKGGLISLTRSLALEWAPKIRVNAVMPGVSDTAQPREAGISDEELYGRGAKIPLGRIGNPEDSAKLVLFLLSDQADYITGQTFAVNGGAIMR